MLLPFRFPIWLSVVVFLLGFARPEAPAHFPQRLNTPPLTFHDAPTQPSASPFHKRRKLTLAPAWTLSTQSWTDTFGQTVLIKPADGTYSISTYDNGGLLTTHLDRAGRTSSYTRDWRGDVTQEKRDVTTAMPNGLVIGYTHDAAGHLLARQMPGGLSEVAQFDPAGRMTLSKLTQAGNTTRLVNYAYHPTTGLLNTATDARGIATSYSYDAALRAAAVSSTGPDAEDVLTRTLSYNERDQVTSIAETGVNGATQVRSRRGSGHES